MASAPPIHYLKTHWGYPEFRTGQRELINAAVAGQDALGLLPTGAGKSIIYQVAGLARGGLTLVVSPLIALMADQVQQLSDRSLPATFVNSTLSGTEINRRLEACTKGEYRFLYLAPERLQQELLLAYLPRLDVRLLAVDEAHCISQWGYDFRPAYTQLTELRQRLPHVPVMALTATATPPVRRHIAEQLHLQEPLEYVSAFRRSNLRFAVLYDTDRKRQLIHVLKRVSGSAIVYVRSRKHTHYLASALQGVGISAEAYHAGLSPEVRQHLLEAWLDDRIRVMVATNAFGMGIDKSDVRVVMHWGMPPELESYYQEAGRAGRDGQDAYAVLLHHPEDMDRHRRHLDKRFPDLTKVEAVYHACAQQHHLAAGELPEQRLSLKLSGVVDATGQAPHEVTQALKHLERCGWLRVQLNAQPEHKIKFRFRPEDLPSLRKRYPGLTDLLGVALGDTGGAAYSRSQPFRPATWAEQLGQPEDTILKQLVYLHQLQLVKYTPPGEEALLMYTQPRKAKFTATDLGSTYYAAQRKAAEERLQAMARYIEDLHTCRSRQVERYFGAEDETDCGRCDICTGRHAQEAAAAAAAPATQRLLHVLANGPLALADLHSQLADMERPALEQAVTELLHEGRIRITRQQMLALRTDA